MEIDLKGFEPYKRIIEGQVWYDIYEMFSERELRELIKNE